MPTVLELKAQLKKFGEKGYSKLNKKELINRLSHYHKKPEKKKTEKKKPEKKLKRCPNGTRRNKNTGECEKKQKGVEKQKLKKDNKEKKEKEKKQKLEKDKKQKQKQLKLNPTKPEDIQSKNTYSLVLLKDIAKKIGLKGYSILNKPVLYDKIKQHLQQKKNEVNTKELHVIKKIGKGGFGETVLVEDKLTGKKYIRKESVSGKESHMRYQFDMLFYLKKKNLCKTDFICPVKKYRDTSGRYFILFDYLDGYDIMYNLKNEPLQERKKYAKDLVDLVLLLHQNKMVHNDLKNNNVMIDTKNNKVRIIDFGVATIDKGKSSYFLRRGKSIITDAPNFYTHVSHSFEELKKNDMWALGNLVYWFLYGHYPTIKTVSAQVDANKKINTDIGTNNITFFHRSLF